MVSTLASVINLKVTGREVLNRPLRYALLQFMRPGIMRAANHYVINLFVISSKGSYSR